MTARGRRPPTPPATDSPPSSGASSVTITVTKQASVHLHGYPTGIPWVDLCRAVVAIGEKIPEGADAVASFRYGTLTVTWPETPPTS